MSTVPREDIDALVERIVAKSSQWVDLTEKDFADMFRKADAIRKAPCIPVSPLPRWAFDKVCKENGIDKDAAIEAGKRFNVDAVLLGFGIIFTQRISENF